MIDWEKIIKDLKRGSVLITFEEPWAKINTCMFIKDTLIGRGIDESRISLTILDSNNRVQVSLLPEIIEKGRRKNARR